MPLIFPRTLGASAIAALKASGRALPGFTLVGGRVPNASGNLPPASIGDGSGQPIDAPPGTAPVEEEASPEAAPPPFTILGWLSANQDKVLIAGVLAAIAYGAYRYGKTKKGNRRRRRNKRYELSDAEAAIVKKQFAPRIGARSWRPIKPAIYGRYQAGGFKSGEKVTYEGCKWYIMDFHADSNSPGGIRLVLVSSDGKTIEDWASTLGIQRGWKVA